MMEISDDRHQGSILIKPLNNQCDKLRLTTYSHSVRFCVNQQRNTLTVVTGIDKSMRKCSLAQEKITPLGCFCRE